MQTPPQASRYVFPALGALYERCQRFAYPILRVAFGLWFIPHGCQKLFGWWGGQISGAAKGLAAAGPGPWDLSGAPLRNLDIGGGVLAGIGFLSQPGGGALFRFLFVARVLFFLKLCDI